MTRNEVLQKLDAMGLSISRETLRRWVNDGLVPQPERGNNGRAGGRWTEYPIETPWEAFASGSLLKDNSIKQVAEIRQEAQQIIADLCAQDMAELIEAFEEWQEENAIIHEEEGDRGVVLNSYKELPDAKEFSENEKVIYIDHLVFVWIMTRIKAEYAVPLQTPITVYINYFGHWDEEIKITHYITFHNNVDWGSPDRDIVDWRINRVQQHFEGSKNDEIIIKHAETEVIMKLRERRNRAIKTGV